MTACDGTHHPDAIPPHPTVEADRAAGSRCTPCACPRGARQGVRGHAAESRALTHRRPTSCGRIARGLDETVTVTPPDLSLLDPSLCHNLHPTSTSEGREGLVLETIIFFLGSPMRSLSSSFGFVKKKNLCNIDPHMGLPRKKFIVSRTNPSLPSDRTTFVFSR